MVQFQSIPNKFPYIPYIFLYIPIYSPIHSLSIPPRNAFSSTWGWGVVAVLLSSSPLGLFDGPRTLIWGFHQEKWGFNMALIINQYVEW